MPILTRIETDPSEQLIGYSPTIVLFTNRNRSIYTGFGGDLIVRPTDEGFLVFPGNGTDGNRVLEILKLRPGELITPPRRIDLGNHQTLVVEKGK